MSGITQILFTDGIFPHARLSVDLANLTEEESEVARKAFLAMNAEPRLQRVTESLAEWMVGHEEDPLSVIYRDEIEFTVKRARATANRQHQTDVVRIAELLLRLFRVYLQHMPNATSGAKQRAGNKKAGKTRSEKFAPLRAWCPDAVEARRTAGQDIDPRRIAEVLHRQLANEFACQLQQLDRSGHVPPPSTDPSLQAAVAAAIANGVSSLSKKSITTYLQQAG